MKILYWSKVKYSIVQTAAFIEQRLATLPINKALRTIEFIQLDVNDYK